MVEYGEETLTHIYAAIADPTRRAILARLSTQATRVTELAEPFAMSLNAVSKHVRVLEDAGLVRREVRGREHYLSLDARPLQEATEWLETYRQFWTAGLDRLETLLQRRRTAKSHGGKK